MDGFRYDYVPGYYEGDPLGPGYATLAYETYQCSKNLARFRTASGASSIIQCAEDLDDPTGIMRQTYSNTCWQDGLLALATNMAGCGYVNTDLPHQLDTAYGNKYPDTYTNPGTGETFPAAPFQYLETHDHQRFINAFGLSPEKDEIGNHYGDRTKFFKTQPYVIGLFTGKGIPFLRQGQEFGENWGQPEGDDFSKILFERPLHWEYFYDPQGKALVRLYRRLGKLRGESPALGSRGSFYYYFRQDHLDAKVIAFRRDTTAGAGPEDHVVVALNFGDTTAEISLPFPVVGTWFEKIDGADTKVAAVAGADLGVAVPSNYGVVYRLGG